MLYTEIVKFDNNKITEALEYYKKEYENAKKEVYINGKVESLLATLPNIIEQRYSQLQDLEGILEIYNEKLKQIKNQKYISLKQTYGKGFNMSEIERLVDVDEKVFACTTIINNIALVRNLFLSIMKGLDSKNFMLNNIVKLRCSGLELTEILN